MRRGLVVIVGIVFLLGIGIAVWFGRGVKPSNAPGAPPAAVQAQPPASVQAQPPASVLVGEPITVKHAALGCHDRELLLKLLESVISDPNSGAQSPQNAAISDHVKRGDCGWLRVGTELIVERRQGDFLFRVHPLPGGETFWTMLKE
jgi:hypothetical protein